MDTIITTSACTDRAGGPVERFFSPFLLSMLGGRDGGGRFACSRRYLRVGSSPSASLPSRGLDDRQLFQPATESSFSPTGYRSPR